MDAFKVALEMLARRFDNGSWMLFVSGGSMAWIVLFWATESLSNLEIRVLLEIKWSLMLECDSSTVSASPRNDCT